MTLFLDLETGCTLPIEVGSYRYSEEAHIQLCATAVDQQPVQVHEWEDHYIDWLRQHIALADRVVVHNSQFDFVMLEANSISVPLHKRYCTMAQARRHGLSGKLDKLCEIFKLPEDKAKMKAGRKLMMLFCKPNKDGTWNTKHTHPEQWAKYKEYAKLDVVSMRELYRLMPKWNDDVEREIWEHDEIINARGFQVDTQFAESAVRILSQTKDELDSQTREKTLGVVDKATQRDKLLEFILRVHGVDLPDLKKDTLERRLKDENLPDAVRELIAVRLDSSKTSTSKYGTLLQCVSRDERLRGVKVYCGAQRTGRFAAHKFQSDNLPRQTLPAEEVHHGIRAIKANCITLTGRYSVPRYASEGLRGAVVAAPGHRLLLADLANIEGRVVAWLAGEQWKLEAFRNYDAGSGPDTYKLAYGRAFSIDPEFVALILPHQRQIGKVLELMLGYGGGVGAFITGAATYRIDLEEMAVACWPDMPRDVQIEAEKAWFRAQEQNQTFGLSREVYRACDGLKRLWRRDNPAIEQLWYDVERAWRSVAVTGEEITVGKLRFDKHKAWLRMWLPSGRCLCYPQPEVSNGQLSFMGVSQYSRKWQRQKTWGGTLVENASQAVARDVLADGMLEAEHEGLPVVLHKHDDMICEVEENKPGANLDLLIYCMTKGWDWTEGLPLAAKGFEGDRYVKED